MSYSTLYTKRSQKMLTILGVVALISFLSGGFFLINQLGHKNGWQKTLGLERVFVVNRNPHGFEVIWSTKRAVKEDQWVEVGAENGSYPIIGNIDYNEGVYHATVAGLNADTEYRFRIRVGNKTYILPSLLSEIVKTPKEVKENPISPAYGKVVLPSTRPYINGLLTYEVDGYYPLAVFTKETGEWLLPLTGLIEKKSNSIIPITDLSPVSIKLFAFPQGNVRTTVGQTRPLKNAITAGKTLNLVQTIQNNNESVLGVNTQNTLTQPIGASSIIYPKEESLIPGNTPLIRGTAPAGRDVTVLIQAPTKQFSYRTKADDKGEWIIQSPLVLGPARYMITATIENGAGLPTIIRRTFSIIKSGEQVLGIATGTPTLIPTIAPTVPLHPTGITTPIPTNTRYPTAIAPTTFVPTVTLPVTGGGVSGFLFGAIFCIVVGAGLVLAF